MADVCDQRIPASVAEQSSLAPMARPRGIAFVRGALAECLPMAPTGALANMRLAEVAEARIVFQAEPHFEHNNPLPQCAAAFGVLLDSGMDCAG